MGQAAGNIQTFSMGSAASMIGSFFGLGKPKQPKDFTGKVTSTAASVKGKDGQNTGDKTANRELVKIREAAAASAKTNEKLLAEVKNLNIGFV